MKIEEIYPEDYGAYIPARKRIYELDHKNGLSQEEFTLEIFKILNEEGFMPGVMQCQLPLSGGTGD